MTEEKKDLYTTIELLGNKNRLGVICELLISGELSFNELKRQINGVNSMSLTRALKFLETHELVERHVIAERPLSVHYCLTDLGREFKDVMDAMELWGRRYQESKESLIKKG